MRTINAPGVEIKEIDKSQYSPAMVGTAAYIMGYTNKGEPYKPMEFTSRTAWTSFYGEPDNEAERYAYAAACEVLNNNGRLYFARLPYDNTAFEKFAAIKYQIKEETLATACGTESIEPKPEPNTAWSLILSNWETLAAKKLSASITGREDKPLAFDVSDTEKYSITALMSSYVLAPSAILSTSWSYISNDWATLKTVPLMSANIGNQTAPSYKLASAVTTTEQSSIYNLASAYYETSTPKEEPNTAWSNIADKWETLAAKKLSALLNDADGSILYAHNVSDEDKTSIVALLSSYHTVVTPLEEMKDFYNQMTSDTLFNTSINKVVTVSPLTATYINQPDVDAVYSDEATPISKGFGDLIIIDKTCGTYSKIAEDTRKDLDRDLIGIMPVVTTAANALYVLNYLSSQLPLINGVRTTLSSDDVTESYKTLRLSDFPEYDAIHDVSEYLNDQALEAASMFPSILMNSEGTALDSENLKKIGVVVFKMYLDPSVGNKISLAPVESFVGSLGKTDVDPNTRVTTFIDKIVNTNSDYIYLFSKGLNYPSADLTLAKPGYCASLGFYSNMTSKVHDTSKILESILKCFDKVSNINERDIDIVCDAGLANIFSYLEASESTSAIPYDLTDTMTMNKWAKAMTSNSPAIKKWKVIEQKLDLFCKKTRKDCMFIADAPRPMVLAGNKKIIRSTKPENTIDANILPNIKWITGLNTSYGAGYLDWFELADDYSGDLFWCPPSIKAMGCYINTDVNYNYWDAPAGLTRGLIAATDVAFSPTMAQAGAIYEKNWNYAINYPADGIVLEGQKTFQVKPSAFDRVNVRRLFLRLERAAYKVARYFVYEGNTAYTRQRLVDRLNPYFKEAKIGGGIYDYKIICDETVNDPDTIDRNELKVKIGIKPVKTAEFILIDFIALSTGGSFEEAMG